MQASGLAQKAMPRAVTSSSIRHRDPDLAPCFLLRKELVKMSLLSRKFLRSLLLANSWETCFHFLLGYSSMNYSQRISSQKNQRGLAADHRPSLITSSTFSYSRVTGNY